MCYYFFKFYTETDLDLFKNIKTETIVHGKLKEKKIRLLFCLRFKKTDNPCLINSLSV